MRAAYIEAHFTGSSGHPWNMGWKYAQLKTENNRFKVDNYTMSLAHPSICSLQKTSLRTSIVSQEIEGKFTSKKILIYELGAELSACNLPVSLLQHFQTFVDTMSTFSHKLTSDKCRSSCNTFNRSLLLALNKMVGEAPFVKTGVDAFCPNMISIRWTSPPVMKFDQSVLLLYI